MNPHPKIEAVLNIIAEDRAYASYFFNKIDDVKWFYYLRDRGYFSPERVPIIKPAKKGGYYIPRWNALTYLEKVSKKVRIEGNEKYIDELLKIIKEVSNYKNTGGHAIDNYRTWHSFVVILSNIPNNKITTDVIDLIPIWLSSRFDTSLAGGEIINKLLPKFLTNDSEDIGKAEKIINYITDFKTSPTEDGEEKPELEIKYFYLKEGFKKYSDDIGKKCTEQVIKDLETKIKKIVTEKEQGTYFSFYEDLEYINKPLDMFTYILKKILLSKAKNDAKTTEGILTRYFKEECLYFPKIALYIIGNLIENYKNFFWDILKSDEQNIIFKNSDNFGDELRIILENLGELDEDQIKILLKKIENSAKSEDFKENQELMLGLYKQKFYKALSHNKHFNDQYKELKNLTDYEIELRPMIGKIETYSAGNISPLTKEEVLEKPNNELAEYLSKFEGDRHWKGPSVNGLAKMLEEIAKENPKKFTDNMNPFLKTGYRYVYNIIWGLKDAWESGKVLDWNNLFGYIEKYTKQTDFWNDKYVIKEDFRSANHLWILGVIGELVKKGAINDSKHFSEYNFTLVQNIIIKILEKLLTNREKVVESQTERNHYITYSLNSTFGKITEALLILAYRINKSESKVNDKQQKIGWNHGIKSIYEKLLDNGIIESYVWLGFYINIIYFQLDKEWSIDKIENIFSEKEKNWAAFMQGYLYIDWINKDIYKIMEKHYKKAMDYIFKEEVHSKRLVQHICYMYLTGIEDIKSDDGLFKTMLCKWDDFQIKEAISWFWVQRDYIMEPIDEKENPEEKIRMETLRKRIIDFWRWIYENKYKEIDKFTTTDDKDKRILSELSHLSVFLKKIDEENFKWLKVSVAHLQVNFNTSFFLEYLDELKDKDEYAPNYIGELFIEILEHSTPDYDKQNIRSIVEYLFENNGAENAKEIFNIYLSRGYDFLRDIYERYVK